MKFKIQNSKVKIAAVLTNAGTKTEIPPLGARGIAKTKAEHTRELVMALLDWDAERYGSFVFEMAEQYLQRQCGRDAYGVQALLESTIFWKWWRNHWAQRDSEFLYMWADCSYQTDVQNEYEFLHSACNLHIRPNKVVLGDTYAVMINDYINCHSERSEEPKPNTL